MEKKQSPGPQQLWKDRKENSSILKVGTGTIHRDLVYLNKQAQDSLMTHFQERLPEQYQKYINELNQVLKIGWNSVNNDSSSAANRLQVYLLSMICYKYIMNLTIDGMAITNDIKFVQNSKEKLIMSNRGQGVKRTGL